MYIILKTEIEPVHIQLMITLWHCYICFHFILVSSTAAKMAVSF